MPTSTGTERRSRSACVTALLLLIVLALLSSCAAPPRSRLNPAQQRERVGFLVLVWMWSGPSGSPATWPAMTPPPAAPVSGPVTTVSPAPPTRSAAKPPPLPAPTRPAPTTTPTRAASPPTTAPPAAGLPTMAAARSVVWPGRSNTGVPVGTTLRASGSVTITTPGAVVDGLDVTGCIYVNADNVTIRRSRVTSTGCLSAIQNNARGLRVEDTEINGNLGHGHCIAWESYTLLRSNLYGCRIGGYLGSNVTIESSWIHDLSVLPGDHDDGLQACGATPTVTNVVIRGNNIEPVAPGKGVSAAIKLGTELGTINGVVIDRNRLDGGGFSFYGGYDPQGSGVAQNVVFTNNTFGGNADFGTHAYVGPNVTWSNNVMERTGAQVAA